MGVKEMWAGRSSHEFLPLEEVETSKGLAYQEESQNRIGYRKSKEEHSPITQIRWLPTFSLEIGPFDQKQ
jgi:nitrate reductase beta subunit